MLGELYHPTGLALETAQVVLEIEAPHACNVAIGCPNACPYCYGPIVTHMSREAWRKVRGPDPPSWNLVLKQLERIEKPEGVFLCFLTDPLHECNRVNTRELIDVLHWAKIGKVATLSKVGLIAANHIRHGMSVVSIDDKFWHKFEPFTTHPMDRIKLLRECHKLKQYSWASLEPYPISAIYEQKMGPLLEQLTFLDLIVFGMWNYDERARTNIAREEYRACIVTLRDFCKSNQIRLHVKSDTMRFIGGF